MSRAAAIGDERRLAGYALAGVEVLPATTAAQAAAAWAGLNEETALVLLTPEARDALEDVLAERPRCIRAVLAP
jgi:vacuolar-type H+-ATPase subunit F/Vma7